MAKLPVNTFADRSERERHYLSVVDAAAEDARAKYVTAGSGQAMTYEIKHAEALGGGGPLLQAEADALGVSLEDVVASVLSARQAWLEANTTIEAARLIAKRKIRAAETAADMHNAVLQFKESL
ncbi:hypothetical protein ACLUEY_01375 [Vreelandella aquamarina]